MYSDKVNVNILTSLLVSHGIKHVVVCPGSRNAPLVHNFNECPELTCHSVTDERSAGFFALGIAQATDAPVAVCVTSGTAILNLSPAVAEAAYRHYPLVVISADRPTAWIGQLDGQTMPQQNVFGEFVGCKVSLPEVTDENGRWHCNRLANEALIATRRNGGKPVHINVPISEPLFGLTSVTLPEERKIDYIEPHCSVTEREIEPFIRAHRPLIVVGQMKRNKLLDDVINELKKRFIVLYEPLSQDDNATWFDEMFGVVNNNPSFAPDYVLYIGETVVSGLLKKYLRGLCGVGVCMVGNDGEVHDVTMHMNRLIACDPVQVLSAIAKHTVSGGYDLRFHALWNAETGRCRNDLRRIAHGGLFGETVRLFEEEICKRKEKPCVHYANSSSVRYGCRYAGHYIYVNRGINGIEGSLSAAAGFSVAAGRKTFLVIGDLSFFYDVNGLWNTGINGNLRIILLNDGGGGIFGRLKGLENSKARDKYVAARHDTLAEGICKSYGVEYISATTIEDVKRALPQIIDGVSATPMLLEVNIRREK
ncbi:MAG: 2-succinyl-5-enolpyruvyl-6-hydroxy-3-cyclohexene-1-carboxylic-acid synthase [Prevotella sp.]|uniref:2-succinyl-5-enolpyruvyl-6-hydroxy-3- cyclohexene-1-carboxylic-acid synthase n=1 Tax=Prevotella sp. TaxID=59823 RepID=UPI002A267750|nr:2-succinyl-5-enolpyruvyl-6-hydroxy-3-cyclohexene-1-carboxylic-acid synthase [Prevotella sp.]MDD7319212.1 2-succinyl-5-enolpyruvyl-6-hydroxy-3-cyclohexene-1-carboxylic-acid synthase [Prevotellaceae bacterium]MDY4020131.1 2-succinyl-5-enolpyruvyl-6-hydroxy-3-cyclohexene-1-carboxylic-acid synthase [Prevotella sp.]